MATKNTLIFFVLLLCASACLSNQGHAMKPHHHHNHHEDAQKRCSRAIETCSPPKGFKQGELYSDSNLSQFTSNCCRSVAEAANLDGRHRCSSQSFLFQWVKFICHNYVMPSPPRSRPPPPPPALKPISPSRKAPPDSPSCSKFADNCGIITGGPAGPGDHYSYLYPINATCCSVVGGISTLDSECFKYISILNEIKNICGA